MRIGVLTGGGDARGFRVRAARLIDRDEPIVRSRGVEAVRYSLFVQRNGLVEAVHLFEVLRAQVQADEFVGFLRHARNPT